jgi:DNA-binding MarR family transcriptional regulator
MADEPLISLERFLPYRLNVLAASVSNALAQVYADRFGLTIPGWRVIATLGQFGVRTGRDVAAHAVMHKSTVSRAVSVLVERGLVRRESNPQDGREDLLALTQEGRAVYEALAPEALAFERELLAPLSAAERDTLFALIARLDRQAEIMGAAALREAAE